MNLNENTETLAGTNLVEKAISKINEKDAKGVIAEITGLMKLVMANDTKVDSINGHSKKLKLEIQKLAAKGGVVADDFNTAQ